MELIVVYNSVPVLPHAYFIYLFISFYNPYIVCAWIGAIKLGDLQSTRFLNSTIYNQTTLCAILSIYLCVHLLLCGLTINHTIKSTSLNGKISSSSSYDIFLRIYYVLFTFSDYVLHVFRYVLHAVNSVSHLYIWFIFF